LSIVLYIKFLNGLFYSLNGGKNMKKAKPNWKKVAIVVMIMIGIISAGMILVFESKNVSAGSRHIYVTIHHIKQIDDIDPGSGAEWYWYVIANGFKQPGYNDVHSGDEIYPDKVYTFDVGSEDDINVAIQLWEEDNSLFGKDDQADISSCYGEGADDIGTPGSDNSGNSLRGAECVVTYSLLTDSWSGDTSGSSGSYDMTSGEDDGGTGDGNDAAVWFEIHDDYTPNPPEIQLTPVTWTFSDTQVGLCSSVKYFTLKNIGGGTATGGVYLSGSEAAHFDITQGEGSYSLDAGQTKTIGVKFCPLAAGTWQTTLYASADYCDDASSSLTGYAPPEPPELELTPNPYYLGDCPVGKCLPANSFYLKNIGGSNAIGTISLSSIHFSLVSGGGAFNLDPGDQKTIEVKFCPQSAGYHEGILIATGSNCDSVSVTLQGTGISSSTTVINMPSSGDELETITCDGSGSYVSGGNIVAYKWDFGDGSFTYSDKNFSVVNHTFWKAGTYTVNLTVWDNNGNSNYTTSAIHIFDTIPDSGLTPTEKTELESMAIEYSPVLYVDPTANYNCPGPVYQITENSILKQKPGDDTIVDYANSVLWLPAFSGYNYYLLEKDHNDPGDNPATYVHFRKENGLYFIQYWFFYYYNEGVNGHEGDWEMIQMSFNSNFKPLKATYSQHTNNYEFNYGEKRDWKNVRKYIDSSKITDHPIVYVSSGTGIHDLASSHANYFYKGDGPISDYTDSCNKKIEFGNSDITILPNLEDNLEEPQWSNLAWVHFAGNWGNNTGAESLSGPHGPAFRPFQNSGIGYRMWTNPFEYENGRLYDGKYYYNSVWKDKFTGAFTKISILDKLVNRGNLAVLDANLADVNDVPLDGKTVFFYVNNTYVGQDVTDLNGYAFVEYNTAALNCGNYIIRVAFDGDQDYSWCDEYGTLVVSGDTTDPTVTVSSPNGGESWQVGSFHTIQWTASDNVGVETQTVALAILIPSQLMKVMMEVIHGLFQTLHHLLAK